MTVPFWAAAVAALSCAAAAGASAQTEYNGDTTREQEACFAKQYEAADARLNQVYRELTAKLSKPDDRALLQAAEQAWIAFRDKECAFETSGTRDGTIHPIVVSVCLTQKTEAHLQELQRQLNCPDGDTGCLH
ncbi:MAG TPA: lysozyme inhibitor LprI family protein [Stellaceae bacterium]|nr:lysozyme inhibitor LprI family protein [Stellaceae bacterium]